MMDLGYYFVGKVDRGSGTFFTVDDGYETHVYERPHGVSVMDIRVAVAVAFIDDQDYSLDYRVTGRYPHYSIEEVK